MFRVSRGVRRGRQDPRRVPPVFCPGLTPALRAWGSDNHLLTDCPVEGWGGVGWSYKLFLRTSSSSHRQTPSSHTVFHLSPGPSETGRLSTSFWFYGTLTEGVPWASRRRKRSLLK